MNNLSFTSPYVGKTSFMQKFVTKACPLLSERALNSNPINQRAIIRAEAETAEQLAWIDAIPVSEVQPGKLYRRVLSGLDICLACDETGQVFATGNKGPPIGVPLSDGSVITTDNGSYIKCPQYGTLFDLTTGTVKDKSSWVPSPPVISNVLRLIFSEPENIPIYAVRERQGILQVLININARVQYEQKYWKGVLDATGKADGGYY